MTTLSAILGELRGLLIEDERYAGTIVVWIALVYGLFFIHVLPAPLAGIVLFVGLAAILIESVAHATRS
jgi:hypothetical protein